jgi:hypothetical protein
VGNVVSASVDRHHEDMVLSLVAITSATLSTSARGAARARPPVDAR